MSKPYPHKTYLLCILIAFARMTLGGIPSYAHDEPGEVPSIHALLIDNPPIIDGIPDDPCWETAVAITDFYQRNPRMGEPATFPVTVRIVYDPHTIYIGFEIHSGDPAGLVSTVLQRDGAVNSYDDHFALRFDTFHDHRDLYYFYINPKGTRLDGHAIDEGVTSDNNWDGVWEVKTSLMPDGWAGEIAIPLYNFRYGEPDRATWGFGCIVYVSETQENVSWPDMRRQSRKPSLFGHITGLNGLAKKNPLTVIPYVIQGSRFGRHKKTVSGTPVWKPVADTWEKDIGLDLRYRPASFLETNLTFNPDFATIEADQFLFNLTLDELQYPEKRPFFTEGQSRFETPIQLLYTRRIGLGDDEVIAGGKMHGRIGSYDFGVMDALTGDGFDPESNYLALRLKRDILRSSTVGLFAVGKNDMSSDMENRNSALGMDINLQFSGAARLTGQIAVSDRPETGGDGYAGEMNFQYSDKLFNPSDNISFSVGLQDAADDFDIGEIGYFGRTSLDRRGAQTSLGYQYWIKRKGINRIMFNNNAWYYRDHEWDMRTQDGVSTGLTFETLSLIAPGFLVETSNYHLTDKMEDYDNSQRTVFVRIGPYPRFRGEVSYRTGDNFGSTIRFIDSEIIVKPSYRMRLTGNVSRLQSDPFGSAAKSSTNTIARIGFNYLFTPDVYWRVFVQSDSTDKLYLVNTLLRYEFSSGSTFYLSYKETRDDTLDTLTTADRQLLAKFSYRLNL